MKLTAFVLIIFSLQVTANSFSQTVTWSGSNVPLKTVLSAIEKQTGYVFIYNAGLLKRTSPVTLSVKDMPLKDVLKKSLKGQFLDYFIENKTVIIKRAASPLPEKEGLENDPQRIADNFPVKGKVTDKVTGEPLAGVTVRVDKNASGVQTNNEGEFKLTAPSSGEVVLVFSHVGYKTKRVTAKEGRSLSVKLEQNESKMDELVVIGYGTSTRRDLTGSVSSVTASDLKNIPINSAEQALAGRLAGVQVTASEGSPDADVRIRVRGGGSITQDNSPLYVVDGMVVDNALSTLSPQDIESIDVLKDASSTSIYGARGANGVVIITTKGGHKGKTSVTYNGFIGIQEFVKELEVMDMYNYVQYNYEISQATQTRRESFLNDFGTFEDLDIYKSAPFVDWQDQIFGRKAVMQTHNVAITGGSDKTQFNLSLTDNESQAVMRNSDYTRKLVNFKLMHEVSSKFKVGFNVRFNNQKVNGAGTSNPGSSGNNFLRQAIRNMPYLAPGQPIDYYDAELVDETDRGNLYLVNPLLLMQSQYKRKYQTVAGLSGYAEYALTNYLSFRVTAGYDYKAELTNTYDDTLTSNSRTYGNRMPIATVNDEARFTFDNSNVLTFSNSKLKGDFNKRNKINIIIGQETYEVHKRSKKVEQRYFPLGTTPEKALGNLNLATPPIGFFQPAPTSDEDMSRISSFFTRVNYSYKNKYLASASLRADGSSVFGPEHRWGYFPAASIAWRISEEKFMEDLIPAISDMKLRISRGEAGNNRISSFLYLSQFETKDNYYALQNQLSTAFGSVSLSNPELKWESMVSQNLGLDVSFFNEKIQLSIDYYSNKGKNLLVDVPVPTTSGYNTQIQNVGVTSNKGVELQLNANLVRKKKFTWSAGFNISFNRNKVLDLARQQHFLINSGWGPSGTPDDFIVQVGAPVGSMYGLVNDGFYTLDDFTFDKITQTYTLKEGVPDNEGITAIAPQPGTIKYRDLNGDSIIDNNNDRTIIGNANPKFFGGLNQQFTYKNFDLNVFINFQYGNDIVNANKLEFSNSYSSNANILAIMEDRWRTVNDRGEVVKDPAELAALNRNAKLWQPLSSNAAFYPQSWAIEDGSFIRINNITLGYSLPRNVISKIKIHGVRAYVTVNNLAVITSYSGYDPEVNTRRKTPMTPGVDFSAYPRNRSYIAGINVTF